MVNNLWNGLLMTGAIAMCAAFMVSGSHVNAQVGTPEMSVRQGATITLIQRVTPDPNCSCRGNGTFYNSGERTCLRTATGRRMALCNKVLNVLNWDISDNPCPDT